MQYMGVAQRQEEVKPSECGQVERHNLARLVSMGISAEDAAVLAVEADVVARARALMARGVPAGYVRRLL